MKIPQNLLNHLQKNKVKHEVIGHKTVFTAYDTAQTLKIKLGNVIKGLIVKADKDYHLVLLTADKMLDMKKLAKFLKAKKVEIITEKMMGKVFKGKPGAFHGFASLYKLPLTVEKNVLKLKDAIMPSGSFDHSLKVKVKDFINLEKPKVAIFSMAKKVKKIIKKKTIKNKRK